MRVLRGASAVPTDDDVAEGPAFSQTAYLIFVVITFGANVLTNPMWGKIGDRYGWRRTVTFAGGLGCAVTTLLVYFVPLAFTEWPATSCCPR